MDMDWDNMADDNKAAPEPILDPREQAILRVRSVLFTVILTAMSVAGFVPLVSSPTTEDAVFTMELAAFRGLNATTGPTVSPGFTLKVRVQNPSPVQPWCSNGGEVIVSYSGVALAWGQVPAFCVRRSAASELTVLPWGWEVGLSEDLRRRLVSEWRTQLSVEMRLFNPDSWTHTEVCRVKSVYLFEPTMLTDVHQGQIG